MGDLRENKAGRFIGHWFCGSHDSTDSWNDDGCPHGNGSYESSKMLFSVGNNGISGQLSS